MHNYYLHTFTCIEIHIYIKRWRPFSLQSATFIPILTSFFAGKQQEFVCIHLCMYVLCMYAYAFAIQSIEHHQGNFTIPI